MAMKRDSYDTSSSGIKVEGDLGDLQIIEEVSDDEDNPYDKQTDSRTISSLPNATLGTIVQNSSLPVFGSVTVTNSDNVQFGNNTYFNGPVTIIQSKSGIDNASYSKTEDVNGGNDDHQSKPKFDAPIKKYELLTWHKVTFSALCFVLIGGICAIILVFRTKTEERRSSTLPMFNTTDSSANTTVEGLNYYNFPVIFVTVILLPITLLLMFCYCSFITKMSFDFDEGINSKTMKNKPNEIFATCAIGLCDTSKEQLLIAPDHLRIVPRSDWLAQPVEGELDKLVQPAPWVIITHTATESCDTQGQCVYRVRLIQSYHIESKNWYDIGYNFLVGGDGSVYYGRGWDYVGAHTKGYNKYSIGIAFIGTFNNESPPRQQVDACVKLIKQGVQLGKLVKDYKLFAHRQLMSTLSPGNKVMDIIKHWPHFVHNLTDINALIPKGY